MVTVLLVGFVCMFVAMGHSLLLHFRSKEFPEIPVSELLFPWPKNGRVVSCLCYFIASAFLLLLVVMPLDLSYASISAWKIFVGMVLVPFFMYLSYVLNGVHKRPKGVMFCAKEPVYKEWALPVLMVVLLNFLYWVIRF